MRRVKVSRAQAPDVQRRHVRILRRHPDHEGVHDRQIERREKHRRDVQSDPEDEGEHSGHLEYDDGRLCSRKEDRSVQLTR